MILCYFLSVHRTVQLCPSTMAEAFPKEPSVTESDLGEKTISVLLLATKWQFDTYGLSTINKSLVNDLRLVDPEHKMIKITCAVVEEGKINYADRRDAAKCGVFLKGAKRPMSNNKHSKPDLSWLDEHAVAYYHHLMQDHHYDFIIGHAPYLANGCFNLKDLYKKRYIAPKIILIFHGLPKKENGDIDDEMLEEWLTEADSNSVESELVPYIKGLDEENRPIHELYIPSYPVELFHVAQEPKGTMIQGTQNITMMSGEIKDLDVTGLDFPLAVNATIGAAEHIRDFDGVRTNLTMLAAHEDDTGKWKSTSVQILEKKEQHTGLSFKTEVPTDISKLQSSLKRSSLFLLPLKPDSPLFGTEALSAIAAGIPILISRYSGIARLLRGMAEDEPVVYSIPTESQLDTWKDRKLEKLLRPNESGEAANRLRELLLLDAGVAQTHLDFINIVAS